MDEVLGELVRALEIHGFREVACASESVPDAQALLRRQTLLTNRAVVVVAPASTPGDFGSYLKQVRKRAAFRCKFVPLLWGLGLQVVVVSPGIADAGIDPAQHVSRVDNQWAIIQSIFLVDPDAGTFRSGRTWGQFITGKYQDAVEEVLRARFRALGAEVSGRGHR
jgi:hypothetical protein